MGIVRIISFVLLPIFLSAQDWPRFELYQLKQGIDSGQFVTTGVDSNLDFNSVLRFRFQDSTLLIGADTVITDATIAPILLATIDAGLGIEVNQVNGQIFIESLSIEDSIYNGSGSIIEKGTPLYASDTQGNYWDVAPARADDPTKMPVVAIAGEEIGVGEVGLGLIKGHIKQVNTTGLADGSQVYVGATGGYTSTKPTDEGVIIQRLGTVIKGETTNGSGIINLGDEGFWNDYTSLTKLRDTLVLVRGSITTEIGDSLTNYASRTELQDTALAIRGDIPSLSGVVLTTTDQDIYGEKYFKNNIELDGALDMWINGNIYIGKYSGSDIRSTNVFDNVIIGTQAYFNGGYANDNTIIGDFAGYNTYGGGNVIIGASANDFYSPSVSVNVSNSVVLGYNANTSEETNTNSIVIGKDALGLGSNTTVIGNSSITKLNSNKYTFNVDQDTTGKDGQVLTFNSSSGELELAQTGDVTTSQLADTALAIRADFPAEGGDVTTSQLADTALAIRADFPAEGGDVTTSQLADTALAIRADFPAEGGDVTTSQLADTALAIRADIPIYISDSLLNYVSRIELGDSLDLYPNRTELGDTALAIRADFPVDTILVNVSLNKMSAGEMSVYALPSSYVGCEIDNLYYSFLLDNFNGNIDSHLIIASTGIEYLITSKSLTVGGSNDYIYDSDNVNRTINSNELILGVDYSATSGSIKSGSVTFEIICN